MEEYKRKLLEDPNLLAVKTEALAKASPHIPAYQASYAAWTKQWEKTEGPLPPSREDREKFKDLMRQERSDGEKVSGAIKEVVEKHGYKTGVPDDGAPRIYNKAPARIVNGQPTGDDIVDAMMSSIQEQARAKSRSQDQATSISKPMDTPAVSAPQQEVSR